MGIWGILKRAIQKNNREGFASACLKGSERPILISFAIFYTVMVAAELFMLELSKKIADIKKSNEIFLLVAWKTLYDAQKFIVESFLITDQEAGKELMMMTADIFSETMNVDHKTYYQDYSDYLEQVGEKDRADMQFLGSKIATILHGAPRADTMFDVMTIYGISHLPRLYNALKMVWGESEDSLIKFIDEQSVMEHIFFR